MAKNKINWAKTLDALSDKKGNEPVGEGWFTTAELMENAKIGHDKAFRLLRRNLKDGVIETHKGSSWNAQHKILSRRVWYRFI